MDERFSDPNTFKPASGRVWDGITLEDFMRIALSQGREEEVLTLLRSLPEDRKERYLEVWKQIQTGRQAAQGSSGAANAPQGPGIGSSGPKKIDPGANDSVSPLRTEGER